MMYTRSHPSIYDEWQRQGNPGWGFSDVLRYFIKSEHNLNRDQVDPEYHGYDGPLKVQRFSSYPPIGEDIIKAGKELGYASGDFNGANQIGVNFAQVIVLPVKEMLAVFAEFLSRCSKD
jgi:Choline dehydrogenase and related flavoproteins